MDPDPKPPFGTAGSAPCPSPGPLRLTTCGDSRRGPERTCVLSGPLLPPHSTIICRLLFNRMSRCFFQSQETASHFNSFIRALLFRKISEHNHSQWRIGRDSNPRGIAPKLISIVGRQCPPVSVSERRNSLILLGLRRFFVPLQMVADLPVQSRPSGKL